MFSTRSLMTLALLVPGCLLGQSTGSPAGQWDSNIKFFENSNYDHLQLELNGTRLSGHMGTLVFEGTFAGGKIEGHVKMNEKQTLDLSGVVNGDRITGTGRIERFKRDYVWEAIREAPPSDAAPKVHVFEPTKFEHYFSDAIEPVLRIRSGDTVKTWSVDAGGTDPKGVRRTSGGNPLTGPFYIENALPGDTLVVHLDRLTLNRDTAGSGDLIVGSAVDADYLEKRKKVEDYDSTWKLDRQAGFASLAKPSEKMKDYKVPLAPMLGCVGVAPGGGTRYRSGYLAGFGGNMDYNQVREGVTIYFRVNAPGALLFLGDGHAAQGAGELTGDALETSMDIEFTVELQRQGTPDAVGGNAPRMENADYLMASGITGTLDDCLRNATTNLTRWLEKRYGLNAAEVSSLLGTAIVYDIAEFVDPQDHVVAKIPKSALAGLKRVN